MAKSSSIRRLGLLSPALPLAGLRGPEAHSQLTLNRFGLLVPGAELSPKVDSGLSFLYLLLFPSPVLAPLSEVGTLNVYVPLHLGFLPGHLEFIPGTCSRQIPIPQSATNMENLLENSLTFLFQQFSAKFMFPKFARPQSFIHVDLRSSKFYREEKTEQKGPHCFCIKLWTCSQLSWNMASCM